MDRTPPATGNEEIELYMRTYYSLLRSSAPIRLRSLEETHVAMNSSLHYLAGSPEIDMAALSYAALRLPACFPDVSLVVMGQMEEVFRRRGYPGVETWTPVRARARRRKMFFDPERGILAAFIASVSDIDDLIPTMVAYQIEWNKIHARLTMNSVALGLLDVSADGQGPVRPLQPTLEDGLRDPEDMRRLREALGLSEDDFLKLQQVWPGSLLVENLRKAASRRLDIQVTVLGSGLSDYRRAAQLWWHTVEQHVDLSLVERPLYFVSSNTHSLVNLLSGFAREHQDAILEFVVREKPENLHREYERLQREDRSQFDNFLYYASRLYLEHPEYREQALEQRRRSEQAAGILRIAEPHCLDVQAQVVDLGRLDPDRLDPRLGPYSPQEWELLQRSDAVILNIDYPLGMAAYHVLSQVSTAVSELLGIYIMGKAATLNGRVGDVMIPNVVYDEHSRNTFLFRNCFTAQDVAPYLNYGTVFDNQKAVTVRGTFLQNRTFMHVFYEEGYTDLEMEAGPYLCATYEDIYPRRYPLDEIVNLFINAPYDIGVLHYASDTPISRRQMLLSKSLSYFGVDATYATTIPIVQRILRHEIERQRRLRERGTLVPATQ